MSVGRFWACALAFSFGLAYAWIAIRFYQFVHAKRPVQAALADGLLGECAVLPLQVWYLSGGNGWVLQAEIAGSAVGTFAALKLGQ